MEPISSAVTTFLATFRVLREMAKQRKLADVSEKLQEVYEAFLGIQRQISSLEDENQMAIPWQVALPQSLPPLHQLAPILQEKAFAVQCNSSER